MATETLAAPAGSAAATVPPARAARVTSIDALRSVVMFLMIFVNDLARAPKGIVPPWMKHFHGKSGLTFVDLVFPAFLFLVGMSIPFALESRLARGEPLWKILRHIVTRTLSLLLIGILMVNGIPNDATMGWSGLLWCNLMYVSAILAFCTFSPIGRSAGDAPRTFAKITLALRLLGFTFLVWLAFAFRGNDGHAIITLRPFSIYTDWYGILGLIGWAYLVGAIVFLVFRANRTALLGSLVLLMCLYPANKQGAFNGFWLANFVNLGETIGSHPAITVAGILLAAIFVNRDTATVWPRVRVTLWFIAGCAAAAMLLHRPYGISKEQATPAFCLWASAVTAALWLIFYYVCDVRNVTAISRPLAAAGQNVLLAYLISYVAPFAINLFHFGDRYSAFAQPTVFNAVARSAMCAFVILCLSTALNRLGFRLKL